MSLNELELCRDVAENIETTLDNTVLYWVKHFKKVKATGDPQEDYTQCKKIVIDHADVIDREFLKQFVETQMFAYYFDCN